MASLLDTTGGFTLDIGLPGAEATGTLSEKDTVINESISGGLDGSGLIDFGVAVAQGTADNGVVVLSATDGSQRVVGISSRFASMSATLPGNIIGHATGREFGLYRSGDVIVIAAEDVRKDDEVIALATTTTISSGISTNLAGTKGGAANGTSRIGMRGHKWKTTTKSGQKGIVSIFHLDGNAVLTT